MRSHSSESFPVLTNECTFKAVRSGGKGGQHVNKVSTKVELYFSIKDSLQLNEIQKSILLQKLHHLLNEEGELRITSDTSRSQLKNKEEAINKLHHLIRKTLTPQKKRIKTKTPKAAKTRRKVDKKKLSETKQLRRKPGLD
ncbi:MAG: alternative ribosome rescue aminoacyl-tRNA hydrolase ArfB [Chitinophagales bacterium]